MSFFDPGQNTAVIASLALISSGFSRNPKCCPVNLASFGRPAVAKPALHAAICNVSILTVVHAKKSGARKKNQG